MPPRRFNPWYAALVVLVATVMVLIVASFMDARYLAQGAEADARHYRPPPVPVAQVRPLAIFWGDSYFNGAGSITAVQAFAYQTGLALGYQPVIKGAGGTGFIAKRTAKPATPNYQDQIKAGGLKLSGGGSPAFIVLEGGLLDQSFEESEQIPAIDYVVKAAKSTYPKARVFLLGPADFYATRNLGLVHVDDAMRQVASKEDVTFIPFSDLISHDELVKVIGSDHIHPTVQGNAEIKAGFEKKLKALGVKPVAQ